MTNVESIPNPRPVDLWTSEEARTFDEFCRVAVETGVADSGSMTRLGMRYGENPRAIVDEVCEWAYVPRYCGNRHSIIAKAAEDYWKALRKAGVI